MFQKKFAKWYLKQGKEIKKYKCSILSAYWISWFSCIFSPKLSLTIYIICRKPRYTPFSVLSLSLRIRKADLYKSDFRKVLANLPTKQNTYVYINDLLFFCCTGYFPNYWITCVSFKNQLEKGWNIFLFIFFRNQYTQTRNQVTVLYIDGKLK